jgi:large subunit ribosomal protein L18
MNPQKKRQEHKMRRKARVRAKVFGTSIRPRLSVFRSLKGINVQLIDDKTGKTLVSASAREVKNKKDKIEVAFEVGKIIAKKAKELNIKSVVFDRAGYKYHGRVKAVADGAREGGLKI